ncbi:MAG: hypothetical protein ACK4IC_05080 [Erythrobacter sp.]
MFLPILAVTLVFLRDVLRHHLAFIVLGPVPATALALAMFGAGAWKVIAPQTALSLLVLFLLIRDDEVPDSQTA